MGNLSRESAINGDSRERNDVPGFKIGDRVRVIHISGDRNSRWVGREGTLVNNPVARNYYPWFLDGAAFTDDDGEGLAVHEDEIEHVDGE